MNAEPLDPQAILEALGVSGAVVVAPVSGGRDTAIWRVEHAGRTLALRVFRSEQAPVAPREIAAMRAASAVGVPVPEVHASGAWRGRPALVVSWMPGDTMLDAARSSPPRARALGYVCGEMLRSIHAVPAPTELRSWRDGPSWGDPALDAQLNAVATDGALLHLDFHPLNVLTDGERATAVLDWTNARSGDPRADLARSITILRLGLPPLTPVERAIVRDFESGLRLGYGDVPDLRPFLAWAGRFLLVDSGRHMSQSQIDRAHAWIARHSGTGDGRHEP